MSRHLVIGGARSGKSRFAQALAEAHAGDVALIVTAEILDEEMRERIARHQAERPAHWHATEAPLDLPGAIERLAVGCAVRTNSTDIPDNPVRTAHPTSFVLVDCLTLWLSNILCTQPERLDEYADALCIAIGNARGELVLVSNEVGWSIVPENSLARRFRDEQGRLNQRVAALCDEVTLVAAGLPLRLKTPS
ncbi:MAG: bifunctional adenosylcobinamide kinase/adenosylcobinamide-phosphate guanylyltransferase [Candidatus Dactylopiibacterium carminicum]|uniref:Bifunctional adenosylcobalamin biosynthesis protein n=1 Tax=Candidatus Dactylopiibacterium carminicum TaxID=857335 RepID=A0A272EYR3_9RHOO|nr:bifunctional adenosylcobinamide kinase/adenosylcobinamide-phosphate guanylyltransferase [Candidatus Dactylopiibacterium carminicum]KAF7597773.1 bifunctional adenosylcobinamide kinase/adenosylcobinamide-phosphate guanylyltransferase [Candidatus Dactylopiibacterium carminicum]PAS95274.1 MAG: bifunctional adenosylcobinamide kinase/adenosylcobinamide-phosphate guanylyltransferase [Candidatus Dactylopiibacterium carminicum]PAS95463.1 MAG: bifunctional adenosylcobinamide kinase/adenosylcobinamide-p